MQYLVTQDLFYIFLGLFSYKFLLKKKKNSTPGIDQEVAKTLIMREKKGLYLLVFIYNSIIPTIHRHDEILRIK